MSQLSIASGSTLATANQAAGEAARLAKTARALNGARAVDARTAGVSILTDQLDVVLGAKFFAEKKALGQAAVNASEAFSLLQTADAALNKISDKLDELLALAKAVEKGTHSTVERAHQDAEFQQLKADIDTLAADTDFKGTKLLQGNGAGGALTYDYKVGTGNASGDDLQISIAAASVSDLDAGLASDTLRTVADATTAKANVADAQLALASIQGRVSGDIGRAAAATRNALSAAAGADRAGLGRTAPTVTVDLAQVVANSATEEAGINLHESAADQIRDLLLDIASRPTNGSNAKTGPSSSPAKPSSDGGGGGGTNGDDK